MKPEEPFFHFSHSDQGNSNSEIPACLKGYFLISQNNMLDPNFFQTVVLIIEHDYNGVFGIVVNRRSKLNLGHILPHFASGHATSTPIYIGGPVQQEYLFVMHSEMPDGHQASQDARSPIPGVIFEPCFSKVEHYFKEEYWNSIPIDERPKMNLSLGYSGWASGQLEQEMQIGSWMLHPAHADIIFHPHPAQGWRDALRQKGGIYKIFANSKQKPELN